MGSLAIAISPPNEKVGEMGRRNKIIHTTGSHYQGWPRNPYWGAIARDKLDFRSARAPDFRAIVFQPKRALPRPLLAECEPHVPNWQAVSVISLGPRLARPRMGREGGNCFTGAAGGNPVSSRRLKWTARIYNKQNY